MPPRDSPNHGKYNEIGQKVISLVVQQILDDSIGPLVSILEIRNLESGRFHKKIVERTERRHGGVLGLGHDGSLSQFLASVPFIPLSTALEWYFRYSEEGILLCQCRDVVWLLR